MYISAITFFLGSSAQRLFSFCGLGFSFDRSFAAYPLIWRARGELCPENDVLKMPHEPALYVAIHAHLPHTVLNQIDAPSRSGTVLMQWSPVFFSCFFFVCFRGRRAPLILYGYLFFNIYFLIWRIFELLACVSLNIDSQAKPKN